MREVPPPFGTGSPSSTTRGLEETPYLGSTRLANLPDEAQLASAKQAATAAARRAISKTGSDRRIPIRPNYHSTGRTLLQGVNDQTPRCSHLRIKVMKRYRNPNTAEMGRVHRYGEGMVARLTVELRSSRI